MSPRLMQYFTQHPAHVGETYLQHMGVALGFAVTLGLAALAAFLHAFVPALCEKTASNAIRRLYARMETRR